MDQHVRPTSSSCTFLPSRGALLASFFASAPRGSKKEAPGLQKGGPGASKIDHNGPRDPKKGAPGP